MTRAAVRLAAVLTAGLAMLGAGCSSSGSASESGRPGELTPTQQRAAELVPEILSAGPDSREGVIASLTLAYEGLEREVFTGYDATVAVDSLDIDWNANALATAEEYLALNLGFSRTTLISLLSSESGLGYTAEQATWAADHLTVDWDEQAVFEAKDMLESGSGISQARLVSWMTNPKTGGFTEAQTTAAIAELNVDWYAQAEKATETIVAQGGEVDCETVIDRLSIEEGRGFTREQARIGARQAGVCE